MSSLHTVKSLSPVQPFAREQGYCVSPSWMGLDKTANSITQEKGI